MGAARLRIGRTAVLSRGGTLDYPKREKQNDRQHYPLEHEIFVLLSPVLTGPDLDTLVPGSLP